MGKSSRNTILTAIATGIVLGAVAIIAFKFSKKRSYSLKDISKFIEDPNELNTNGDSNSWKNMDQHLLSVLEKVSRDYGSKLKVNSGFRSPEHNASVNGAKQSAHLHGHAVDVHTGSYAETIRMGRIAKKHGIVRMGIGNTFIHLDVNRDLPQTRWTYNGMTKSKVDSDLGFA